ncbi:MAG: AAA family ATPase [Patescibacteria group bacterium]
MYLKKLELSGFKSFSKPTRLEFPVAVTAIVGPNGSGKSNVAESIRWVLGEQSMKTLRGRKGEDLIFNGSQTAPRLNKASVSLFFDNSKKIFPIDYEEIKISRKVFRDGNNEYLLNDSKVRFRDIVELLSRIGIGPSSHNMIGQGESDRILNTSLKERRQMIEDALGLKVYQLKKSEAEKKLAKTEENIKQVEGLKKEIQPHLKFLKRQVEKIEQALSFKEKLRKHYSDYFLKEKIFLDSEEESIKKERKLIEKDFFATKAKLSEKYSELEIEKIKKDIDSVKKEIFNKEREIDELRLKRNSIERELGRIEGMVEAMKSREQIPQEMEFSKKEIRNFLKEIEKNIVKGLSEKNNIDNLKLILEKIRILVKDFSGKLSEDVTIPSEKLKIVNEKQLKTKFLLAETEKKEREIQKAIEELKRENSQKEDLLYILQKEGYEMEIKFKELKGVFENLGLKERNLILRKEEMDNEIKEAAVLIGDVKFEKLNCDLSAWETERAAAKREIEKIKIRLEDSGGISEELIREYEEVKKRNDFFDKELNDLYPAVKSLENILDELEKKINNDFREGLEKINKEFQEFFTAMFGGGKAELRRVIPKKEKIEDEETENKIEEEEEGIEVYVNLPKKKINSLSMLSGGERALTSIALLFAMTQVNPPPFLILDEIDAALDEANSQRYGKMLKDLSTKTQLILITHNRETMKQADILYGVTMGSDSISKLLSIKFPEAERYTSQ